MKKFHKVIKNIKPPISAREAIRKEPIIRIYPDYNPRFSRNQMKSISIKAWETTRTMATTPFTSEIKDRRNVNIIEGFSKTSVHYASGKQKPKTATVGLRSKKKLKKSKTVTKLQFPKPQSSQVEKRPKLTSRWKSRKGNFMKDFHSLFSKNCKSESIIHPKKAKKYERKIMKLKNEINTTQNNRKEVILKLTEGKH